MWARPLSRMRIIAFAKGTQGIVKLEALIFIFLEKVIEMRRCSEVAFKSTTNSYIQMHVVWLFQVDSKEILHSQKWSATYQ